MLRVKACFLDCETTGVNPDKNGVTQFAGAIGSINGETGEFEAARTFNLEVSPFLTDEIEDEALKVQNRTREMIGAYPGPGDVYRTLLDIFTGYVNKYDRDDKMFLIGYNSPFDASFLRAFWTKNKDNYYGSLFFVPDICVMRMAAEHLKFYRHTFPDFKLATVAKRLGIETPEGLFHDALTDINVTIQIFNKLQNVKGAAR
jgi:DNA polymerase-3 subunit epsilon